VYIIENTLDGNCKPCEKKMFYSAIVSLSMFKGFSVMKTANIYETGVGYGVPGKNTKEFQ
jgi:ERCC4-type nuclease